MEININNAFYQAIKFSLQPCLPMYIAVSDSIHNAIYKVISNLLQAPICTTLIACFIFTSLTTILAIYSFAYIVTIGVIFSIIIFEGISMIVLSFIVFQSSMIVIFLILFINSFYRY